MEREKFEKEFGDAFKGAEQSPSENVWVNVELELERAEGKKMKQRVLFYQMLAAASITFAVILMGAGILFIRNFDSANTPTIASNAPAAGHDNSSTTTSTEAVKGMAAEFDSSSINDRSPLRVAGETNDVNKSRDKTSSIDFLASAEKNTVDQYSTGIRKSDQSGRVESGNKIQGNRNGEGMNSSKTSESYSAEGSTDFGISRGTKESINGQGMNLARQHENIEEESGTRGLSDAHSGESELLAIERRNEEIRNNGILDTTSANSTIAGNDRGIQKEETVTEESSEPDPVALMFARLNDLEKELAAQGAGGKKNKNAGEEKIWTSVGFAAGGYNGQASAPAQMNAFALNSAVESQAKASGVAYSVNISMGTRVTNRLVVQGGVSYLNNSTSYTSNQVVRSENMDFKPATISDLRAAGSSLFDNNTVIPTAPHSVNSNMEFISVPVQAGYIIIDRRFGLQLNAGVATDFFIQNTINPQGSGVQSTTQDRGADSPYRSTNFSGLMGTEFTYRLSDRYRVALNPGLRYPFNSIYKEETGIESTPLTFDVGLRFRYIFR